MRPYLETPHNQKTQLSPVDFQMLQKKHLQEDLNRNQRIVLNNNYVSEQVYWDQYYEMEDVSYEWCNGQLEEKPMADLASFFMYNWFLLLLNEYFRSFPEGIIVGLEIGFKMNLPDTISIRKPDLAFIHKSNPVQMQLDDRSYKGCFDMCIEFLSDSNKIEIERDTVIKKLEYEQSGIKEYYILDRKHKHTIFYRLNDHGQYNEIFPDKSGIIKSTVLPNFQFRYDDLFTLPSNDQLRKDHVYKQYFQTDYTQETKRAQEAERKADEAKRKADEAKRKAAKEKKRADDAIAREKKLLQELAILKKRANKQSSHNSV